VGTRVAAMQVIATSADTPSGLQSSTRGQYKLAAFAVSTFDQDVWTTKRVV
jgi:hypothetical protein